MKLAEVILVTAMLFSKSTSIRVLGLFPHPGISHFNFFHPIMLGLAEVGHDVTVVSHFPDSHAPSNYKDIKIEDEELMVNSVDLELFEKRHSFRFFREFFTIYEWGRRSCELALNSKALEKVLAMKEQFDVVIVEQFNSDCMVGVAWKLKAPFIGLSSTEIISYHYDRLGIPLLPSHVPTSVSDYTDKMSFLQRLSNWIAGHSFPMLRRMFMDQSDDALLRKQFGDDMPSVTEISKQISLMFVNTHYSLSGPKLLPPTVVELGGAHIKKPKAIDKTVQHILDSAEHGVIYVSWGSMIRAKSLPEDKREALLQAFATFKQTVLWKWENDTLANQPDNVFIQKWMPQQDILCHPNVRVFMTHGGLLGSSEAAYCGVPVVATPIYGDQFYNSAALVNRGMGIILEFQDITKTSVINAIQFALDKSTKKNAKKVSFSFKNRPQHPIETAVWWVEHVASTTLLTCM
ncbi:UDP-glycosyltransferase UGT5 [Pseudolycoriella hygida]|uniref:UDP-glucuronosyltransferase n=1 Tax=Pseudolycoriella hygida TaxID=35572 RepID=A0A9Q0NDA4_9DIPT|nr:UDP-glycosyltransferase UGT5 [Pseudolycoriella hygida]